MGPGKGFGPPASAPPPERGPDPPQHERAVVTGSILAARSGRIRLCRHRHPDESLASQAGQRLRDSPMSSLISFPTVCGLSFSAFSCVEHPPHLCPGMDARPEKRGGMPSCLPAKIAEETRGDMRDVWGVHVPNAYGGTRSDVSMTRSDVYGVHVPDVYGLPETCQAGGCHEASRQHQSRIAAVHAVLSDGWAGWNVRGVHVPNGYGGTRSDVSMTRSDVYGVHVPDVYGSPQTCQAGGCHEASRQHQSRIAVVHAVLSDGWPGRTSYGNERIGPHPSP